MTFSNQKQYKKSIVRQSFSYKSATFGEVNNEVDAAHGKTKQNNKLPQERQRQVLNADDQDSGVV